MTREIKFRGKRVDNGEWVYGSYLHQYFSVKNQKLIDAIAYTDGNQTLRPQVDPKTVGQFTGIKDSKAINRSDIKDIYEDDIVLIVDIGEHGESRVTFEDGMFCIDYWGTKEPLSNFTDEMRVFVIGNIHDNPDLVPSHG